MDTPALDNLPLEIILEILSYNTVAYNREPTPLHPLNSVAAANKHLHAVVEEYTRGLLKQYANFTPPRSKAFSCRRKWLAETCQFCKRKSQRRAILYPTLTCCRLCDKQYFAKITMTQATKDHSLSKLDLFTPNALHPSLPPLTTGLYTVMGSAATMILERDLLARKALIFRLLGPKAGPASGIIDKVDGAADSEGYMRRRAAAHDRIIAHMGLYFCTGNARREAGWRRAPTLTEAALAKAAKSMRTEEGRREYVRKSLEREWEAMGLRSGASGMSREDAVLID